MAISSLFKKIWNQRENATTNLVSSSAPKPENNMSLSESVVSQSQFVSMEPVANAIEEFPWPPQDLSLKALQECQNPAIQNLYEQYKEYLSTASGFGVADSSIVSFAFSKNNYRNLNLSQADYQELFDICEPEDGKWSAEILAVLADANIAENVNLSQEQIDYLADNTDVNKHLNSYKVAPIALIFAKNLTEQLNLSQERMHRLLEQTDLSKESYTDYSTLNAAISFNQINQLGLSSQQFDYLLQNSKLSKPVSQDDYSLSIHCVITAFAALGNGRGSLNFEQIDYLFQSSGLDIEKIETFKTKEKQMNYIFKLLSAPGDNHSDYYKEKVFEGYTLFKPEKLKILAIEKENHNLKNLVATKDTGNKPSAFKI